MYLQTNTLNYKIYLVKFVNVSSNAQHQESNVLGVLKQIMKYRSLGPKKKSYGMKSECLSVSQQKANIKVQSTTLFQLLSVGI